MPSASLAKRPGTADPAHALDFNWAIFGANAIGEGIPNIISSFKSDLNCLGLLGTANGTVCSSDVPGRSLIPVIQEYAQANIPVLIFPVINSSSLSVSDGTGRSSLDLKNPYESQRAAIVAGAWILSVDSHDAHVKLVYDTLSKAFSEGKRSNVMVQALFQALRSMPLYQQHLRIRQLES